MRERRWHSIITYPTPGTGWQRKSISRIPRKTRKDGPKCWCRRGSMCGRHRGALLRWKSAWERRAGDTYFPPHWLALNQRVLLQGLSTVATELVLAPANRQAMRRLADLRQELLRSGALARFRHISPNPGLERFYELCVKGLGVS